MIIKTKWEFGQSVYFKTDPEQLEYLITGIILRQNNLLVTVSNCGEEKTAYELELTKEKDNTKGLGLNLNLEEE